MNVSSPKKRVPTAKDRQNKNIPYVPAELLAVNNAIPKQNVGIDQTNQLQFDPEVGRIFSPIGRQTCFNEEDDFSIPFKTYIRIDEDPFEFLTEGLFDTPLSEDNISIQPEVNEESVNDPNEEINWVTSSELFHSSESSPSPEEAPKKEVSISTRKRTYTYLSEAVENHPLVPMVKEWKNQSSDDKNLIFQYNHKINRFIQFLIDKKIDAPTKDDVSLYDKYIYADKTISFPHIYISAVRSFFKWTNTVGLYENIAYGTDRRRNPKKRPGSTLSEQPQSIAGVRKKDTITINDMEKANFIYNQALYLINNDLQVFKKWVETLDIESVDAQKKSYVLRFAYFLHSQNRTTPTQQDIVDYYKQQLSTLSPNTINYIMTSIKHFFEWTAEETIYPNIAINICRTTRKPINANDIPILPAKKRMQLIPRPTKPLINKTI